ncbi:MAG: T9SS type A sorting domain-containing protein [Paludibacter sp.]
MKINYKVIDKMSKHTSIFTWIFTLIFSCINVNAQTAHFEDNFERILLTPGGSPETNYVTAGTGNATVNLNSTTVSDANFVKFTSLTSGGVAGQLFLAGDISKYGNDFNTKLKLNNVDSVMWTFNMRQNNNNTMAGFNSTQRGVGVILAADNSDLSIASGYAVIQTGASSSTGTLKLVKFTNGLNNTNILALVSATTTIGNSGRDYMSVKVTYLPATDTWRFYDRSDLTVWADPTNATGYKLEGSVVDATFTNTIMTNFGFVFNYSSSSVAFNFICDNYKVTSYKTATNVVKIADSKNLSVYSIKNGFTINVENAEVTVFDVSGKICLRKKVFGNCEFTTRNGGIYVVQVKTKNAVEVVKMFVK